MRLTFHRRQPSTEDDLKILKGESLSYHYRISWGTSEEILEEISSVALLSPACYLYIIIYYV
jgi:hypothetical protein